MKATEFSNTLSSILRLFCSMTGADGFCWIVLEDGRPLVVRVELSEDDDDGATQAVLEDIINVVQPSINERRVVH